MARTLLICGYGPGISDGVARKFGAEGFQLALVARSKDKLDAAVSSLAEAGITARAFPRDLSDPSALRPLVAEVREQLGPVHSLHWNAYAGLAGDLSTCEIDELRTVFDVGVISCVAAVQAALEDMRGQAGASVLITGGGFAVYQDAIDKTVVQWNAMGLALAKAAQHKLTGLLHHKLATEGIYVGSVVVLGLVKGTAFDQGGDGLDPQEIGEAFWTLAQARDAVSVNFPG